MRFSKQRKQYYFTLSVFEFYGLVKWVLFGDMEIPCIKLHFLFWFNYGNDFNWFKLTYGIAESNPAQKGTDLIFLVEYLRFSFGVNHIPKVKNINK